MLNEDISRLDKNVKKKSFFLTAWVIKYAACTDQLCLLFPGSGTVARQKFLGLDHSGWPNFPCC